MAQKEGEGGQGGGTSERGRREQQEQEYIRRPGARALRRPRQALALAGWLAGWPAPTECGMTRRRHARRRHGGRVVLYPLERVQQCPCLWMVTSRVWRQHRPHATPVAQQDPADPRARGAGAQGRKGLRDGVAARFLPCRETSRHAYIMAHVASLPPRCPPCRPLAFGRRRQPTCTLRNTRHTTHDTRA